MPDNFDLQKALINQRAAKSERDYQERRCNRLADDGSSSVQDRDDALQELNRASFALELADLDVKRFQEIPSVQTTKSILAHECVCGGRAAVRDTDGAGG